MSKKRTIALSIIGIFLLISLVIGISYALWRVNLFQTTANTLASDCFNITFTEENNIELLNTYPMYDEDGSKLTPYTFTIKNNCASYAVYQVQLEVSDTSTLSNSYLKVMVNEESPSLLTDYQEGEITLDDANASYILENNTLDKNKEKTYNLRLWLDETVTVDTPGVQNSTWSAKVTITARYIDHIPSDYEKCVEKYGEDSVNCQIIARLDTTGKCPEADDSGNITISDMLMHGNYVCSAPDDYGVSYYLVGYITNNYVKFGKNENGSDMYWRIIRINGDDSIRMIYDGTAAHQNTESNTDRILGQSSYNSLVYEDNAYVGYMYGTTDASSYEETHRNTNSSTIKQVVDSWYESVFLNTAYEQYLADEIFCNDRSFSSDNTGTGIGSSDTLYRWYGDVNGSKVSHATNFKCFYQNDRFTVDDERIGNGDLTYPIGLITADELQINNLQFSYSNSFWTMTPSHFQRYSHMRAWASSWEVPFPSYSSIGIKPVINLKPNSLKFGDGTASNPYRIAD